MSIQDSSMSPVMLNDRFDRRRIHPLHAYLLASATTLLVGALLSDVAYFKISEIQWKNFATWLMLGGLVFGGLALLWALIDIFRARAGTRRPSVLYFVILLAAWAVGVINQLVHAKDAFATMPEGLILSVVMAVLALIATVLGFSTSRTGVV
jgi:uncharacterized membrane protein